MKVLFTFYIPSGGMATLNRLRGESLLRNGIEAHFLYTSPGTAMNGTPSSCPVFFASGDEEIAQLIRTHQYDAIVVTSDYLLMERLRRLGFNRILLYECQGFGVPGYEEQLIISAAPYLHTCCNAVLIPPTDHVLKMFLHHCPWLQRYILVNILDSERFQYVPGDAPATPVIAWVGRLEPNKNWREFLEISASIRSSKPDLRLWMFHDPALAHEGEINKFDTALRELGLADRLDVFSHIPNQTMPHYYSRVADSGGFLLSTSVTEGFGYAVAEAVLCSCPVLSTDSDGVRSFIVHNVSGKFYPLGNTAAGAAEGLDLMNNVPLRSAISAEGRNRLATGFSPEQYANSFRQVMNSFSIF